MFTLYLCTIFYKLNDSLIILKPKDKVLFCCSEFYETFQKQKIAYFSNIYHDT